MTDFTLFLKAMTWTDATVDVNGNPLPSGEALVSTTIGIRADGDASHAAGNYQWLVVVPAPAASESVAAVNAAINAALPVGNYWAAVMQTDSLNGASSSSGWSAEVPFAVPPAIAVPAAPSGLAVS